MKPKLLIIEDDQEICSQIKWAVNGDYEVLVAPDRPAALEAFKAHSPAVVLLDLGLPPLPTGPEEGLAVLSELLTRNRLVRTIVVSGQGGRELALKAIGSGACDFISKPIQAQELKIVVKRAFHVAALEKTYLESEQRAPADEFEGMLGASPQMQQVFRAVRKVAATKAPVLLLGESGTGKEMVARAIHRLGERQSGPFVAVNCSAIPESLLESELFGHERGAFTGAHMQRKGLVESAEGGTLFLDEIGDVPSWLQVKLLRFLQEQQIERVGGRQSIRVNVRVVAATHVDLKKAIKEGRFREDLYFRLAVVCIALPALRDRQNDIPHLARTFLRKCAAQLGKKGVAFTAEAMKALEEHHWPGNVRELENRITCAVILAEGPVLTAEDLGLSGLPAALRGASLKDARELVEREMVERALRKYSGKIAPAATSLNVSRPTLYELMEKLGLRRPGLAGGELGPA
jgi:two-component system NtrC family response regulator